MRPRILLFASVLAMCPAAALAQSGDCGSDVAALGDQLSELRASKGVTEPQPPRALSGRAITENRMATASQNPNAATVPAAAFAPNRAEGLNDETPATAVPSGGVATTLAQAQSSLQAAQAANARGDDAACQRQVADARQLLDSVD